MHLITTDKSKIKIIFDKKIQNWTWDKGDIKYKVDSWKDKTTILYSPMTLNNFKVLYENYSDNKDFQFAENFITGLTDTIKSTELNDKKMTLLKEKVTMDTIDKRPSLINHKGLPPFKHQKIALEYSVRFPGFYDTTEMGLGKSRVAIERHIFLKEKLKVIDKSLIICPVTLMYNWANEIKEWSDYQSLVVSGTKKQKLDEMSMFKTSVDFFVINFEGIESIKNELYGFVNKKTNIIIDEFIKIKNSTARRSKNVIQICEKTDYVDGLCGTPISQGSTDLFSPSLAIDKGKKFGLSQERFISKYFWKSGYSLQAKFGSHDKISEKLYENAIRFTKSECLDIPDKLYSTIPIELGENLEAYNQMLQFCMAYVGDSKEEITAPILLVQLLRLSQITSGFSKNSEGEIIEFKTQPKLAALSDLLEQNNSHQIIIWSRFIRDVKAIADMCIDKGLTYDCLIGTSKEKYHSPLKAKDEKEEHIEDQTFMIGGNIDSEMPIMLGENQNGEFTDLSENLALPILSDKIIDDKPKDYSHIKVPLPGIERQGAVDRFQNSDTQVIIGTASTGGLGINLTKASRVIYYSNDYSLLNRLQSEDRAHRAGQKNQVNYYDIVARDTVDISILDVLKGKKRIADVITKDNLLNVMKGEL